MREAVLARFVGTHKMKTLETIRTQNVVSALDLHQVKAKRKVGHAEPSAGPPCHDNDMIEPHRRLIRGRTKSVNINSTSRVINKSVMAPPKTESWGRFCAKALDTA